MVKMPDFDPVQIALLPWKPQFVKTIRTPHGRLLDMYRLVDLHNGEEMASLAVPHGRTDLAGFIAASVMTGVESCRRELGKKPRG